MSEKVSEPVSPKYPDITVDLTGKDGNAFSIPSMVRTALHRNGVDHEVCDQFMDEAMNGDYNHLLRVCMAWVNVT